jgi:hypothetical protein
MIHCALTSEKVWGKKAAEGTLEELAKDWAKNPTSQEWTGMSLLPFLLLISVVQGIKAWMLVN